MKTSIKESKELQRMDDLLMEIDNRLAGLAKQISKDNTIDDDVSGGHLEDPFKTYVEELYSIGNYIDENRVTPTEIHNKARIEASKSKVEASTERWKSMPRIFKLLAILQFILIIAFLYALPFIWIWYDWALTWKIGLTEFIGIWMITQLEKIIRKTIKS